MFYKYPGIMQSGSIGNSFFHALSGICWNNSMCMGDTTSQLESAAPELLSLWEKYGRQIPQELARDVNLGGVSTNLNPDPTLSLTLP